MSNPRQLTSREAAGLLGMSLRTFLRRVADGDIKPAQQLPGVRGAYLFDADEIDRAAS